jgi:hypothetical protein
MTIDRTLFLPVCLNTIAIYFIFFSTIKTVLTVGKEALFYLVFDDYKEDYPAVSNLDLDQA